MRLLLFLSFTFVSICGFSQDTIQLVKFHDKTKTFWLVSKKDTTMYSYYPNGKKESERKYDYTGKTIVYKRWYENGKLMWEKEIIKGVAHGKTVFYDKKGIKAAELTYENGEVMDTVFIRENTHLLLGKITSKSVVYGGMERVDGSSNISEHSGPWMYCSMYAAKVDSLKKPELIENFRSDHNGDFFVLAPEGKISFFPASVKIEELKPGEYYVPPSAWRSGRSGWNYTGPYEVHPSDEVIFVSLHHYSEGYAP